MAVANRLGFAGVLIIFVVGVTVFVITAEPQRHQGPCDTGLAGIAPQVNIDTEVHGNGTITIHHEGGDPIEPNITTNLTIEVVDAETGTTWAKEWELSESGGRVERGDEIQISQESIEGVSFTNGDEIRVIWVGYPKSRPRHCGKYTVTLGKHVIGQGTKTGGRMVTQV